MVPSAYYIVVDPSELVTNKPAGVIAAYKATAAAKSFNIAAV